MPIDFMRKENAGQHLPLGTVKHITLHWTAGGYNTHYDHYHFNIEGDGTIVQTLSTKYKGSHCWFRNANNIGISLCAMAPGCPVTPIQIEKMAAVAADLCGIFGLNIDGTITLPAYRLSGNTLVATGGTITAPVIADHAFYAKKDGYYPDRVDIESLYAKVMQKARWYRTQTIAGKRQNELVGLIN